MRTPYAMRTLINEVTDVFEDAGFTITSPDGFNVARMLTIDAATSDYLGDLLFLLDDKRIVFVRRDGREYEITFVSDIRADDKTPFHVNDAVKVLRG